MDTIIKVLVKLRNIEYAWLWVLYVRMKVLDKDFNESFGSFVKD